MFGQFITSKQLFLAIKLIVFPLHIKFRVHGSSIMEYQDWFNPIRHGLFMNCQLWGGGHDSVVIAPMIMKFGTGAKLDVFYTIVTKNV